MKKELITLLEPYANKELKEGCLLQSIKTGKIIQYCGKTEIYKDNYIMALGEYNIVSRKLLSRYKIIGTINLATVLRFVSDYGMYVIYEIINDEIYIGDSRSEDEVIGTLPLKDPSEYTDEEVNDTLVILKNYYEQQRKANRDIKNSSRD